MRKCITAQQQVAQASDCCGEVTCRTGRITKLSLVHARARERLDGSRLLPEGVTHSLL